MDPSTLVGDPVYDGRRFVERFAADGNPVQAAFWVKPAEGGVWKLYLATELVDRDGRAAAIRAVHASLQKLGESGISSSEIKVISPNDPIAKDALAVIAYHSGRLPIRIADTTLGTLDAEQAYIYPRHFFTFIQANPMTTEDISREIVRLMNSGSPPCRVALRDGTAFNGVPFSLELGTQRAMMVKFIADGETPLRVVRLDEISSIS